MRDGQRVLGWCVSCVSFFFFFFFLWLKDRVRVQKVMYCQWVKVDYKGQRTQKKNGAKKDVGCVFFPRLKCLRGSRKVSVSKRNINEDICSFWVSTKAAQLIVVQSHLQEIKFRIDLKNFSPLTFQAEVFRPGKRVLHCAIPDNLYGNRTDFEMKCKPFNKIVCFAIWRQHVHSCCTDGVDFKNWVD